MENLPYFSDWVYSRARKIKNVYFMTQLTLVEVASKKKKSQTQNAELMLEELLSHQAKYVSSFA